MKKKSWGIFSFVLLLSPLIFPFTIQGTTESSMTFRVKMTTTYHNNNATMNWIFTEEDRTIGLFMNNSWQHVELINSSFKLEKTTFDGDGNPIALLDFPKSELIYGENMSFSLDYQVFSDPRFLPSGISKEASESLDVIPQELIDRYCRETTLWSITDPNLQELASNIAANETNVLEIVTNLVTWIQQNISYPYPDQSPKIGHELPLYPHETLQYNEGDCDDQAILLITLCRILEIPAYLQLGCIYDPRYFDDSEYWNGSVRNVLIHVGWHGWAIVYIPPWGWLPVDLTYVLGRSDDVIEVIEKAAVTSPRTILHMNISLQDYIISTKRQMEFLEKHGFYVHAESEIIQVFPTNPLDDLLKKQYFWILIAAPPLIVGLILVGNYLRRKDKRVHINKPETSQVRFSKQQILNKLIFSLMVS
jgi:hypothetical protein